MGGVLIDDTERTDVFVASTTSTGEGSITIEGKHIEGFRRYTQQQSQLDRLFLVPVRHAEWPAEIEIKPRSKRGQRKRIWRQG